MKFLIKMYISSMKIALYTYLKGSASEIVSVALTMSSESPQSVPKKKKPSEKWQQDFHHWGPINQDYPFRELNRSNGCYICLRLRAAPARPTVSLTA